MESTSLQRALADPLLEGGPQNPHSIVRRLVQAVFRGKALVILCMAIGGLVASFIALAKPNEYQSQATFRFRTGSESLPVDPGLNLDQRRGGNNLTGNAPFILQAPELMRRVAERVGIETIMQPYKPGGAVVAEDEGWFGGIVNSVYRFQKSLHDVDPSLFSVGDAADMIAANIELMPYRQATLLQVSYSANDPQLAEDVLAAYVDEAQQFHMQVYGDNEAIQLVQARHDAGQKYHLAAKQALKAFLDELQINDFMAEYGIVRQRETTTRQLVADLQIEIRTLKPSIQKVKEELAKSEPFEDRETTVDVPNPRIPALTAHIQTQEQQLVEVRKRFNESSFEVRSILKALQMLKRDLEEEQKRPVTQIKQVAPVANPQHQRLTERLADAELRLAIAKESLVEAEVRLDEIRKQVKFLGGKLDQFRELDQTNVERRDELRRAEGDLAVARAKERLKLSNLSALSLVVPPSRAVKVGPQRKLMLLMGLFVGMGIAVGILALRAMMDTTVRSPEELEQLAGLRVLACVPQLDRKNLCRHEQRLTSGC